jgi:hypothetical protein
MTKVIRTFQLTGEAQTVEELTMLIPEPERARLCFRNHVFYEEAEQGTERYEVIQKFKIGDTIAFYGKALEVIGVDWFEGISVMRKELTFRISGTLKVKIRG